RHGEIKSPKSSRQQDANLTWRLDFLAQILVAKRVAPGGGAQKVSTRVTLASWRLEFLNRSLLHCVPKFHGAVAPAGSDGRAVFGNGDSVDGAAVALERAQFLAAGHVPELGGAVFAAGGEPAAVGGEGDRPDVVVVAFEPADLAAHVDVP